MSPAKADSSVLGAQVWVEEKQWEQRIQTEMGVSGFEQEGHGTEVPPLEGISDLLPRKRLQWGWVLSQ
jgi:hypothetical protein